MSGIGRICYLFLNAFRVCVVLRFLKIFFGENPKIWVPLLCFAYYMMNSAGYLSESSVNMNLFPNIAGLSLLVILGYKGDIKKKMVAVVLTTGIGAIAENLSWVIFVKDKDARFESYGCLFSVTVFFIIEILIQKTIRVYRDVEISWSENLLPVMLPVGSVFVADVLIERVDQNTFFLAASLCILLMLNIFSFYLYEKRMDDYLDRKDREHNALQLEMYRKQLQVMQNANDNYRMMRHDIRHHSILIADYIRKGESESALQYLEKMNHYIADGRKYIETGNRCVDSILNYIIDELQRCGGDMETDIKIAEELFVDDFDINVILSNLLLNACEAVQKVEKKNVKLIMRYDRGVLMLTVRNTYDGTVKERHGELVTTKEHAGSHGIGLRSVRKTVAKYGGEMKISHNEDEFEVKILLYIGES